MINIKAFEVNYFSENTYLLYDETNEAVLIDCGCMEKEEERELSEFIADNHLVLKRYLCTHLHLDHIFGNEFVYKTYGLSPEAHKADVEMLPSPEKQAVLFGIPQRINTVSVKKFLSGGEIVRFGNAELEVLTVPGHSPGSVAFYNKENGFIVNPKPEEVAACFDLLYDDMQMVKKYGKAGYERVKNISWDHVIEELTKTI